ncbi:SCO family protein [Sphingomonas astaxanthinifaciens]|uniref:Photosynthetic protein synthase I n=1 Tax=Sphingomonas astaxanthinifaciens DSM 22298 TaxID=1123267 RepID=A0ABQ5Z9N9_9SPHN|nr:SCO family protein [Sphingomonas astaxanthinifaciens]GLR48711.1 photosynthetic protein synthase I [Sphingomonas astaxanthinifaciens DSM 22298]
MATERGTKRLRWILWGLVGIALVGFALLLSRPAYQWSRTEPGSPGFTIGGPFTLTGTDGKPFSSTSLAGKPYVVFFGFTHCPDVCPNTLGRLAKLRRELGKGDDAFTILFVTVDPKRDTPRVVGDYLQLFGTPIVGLTGTEAQVAAVAKSHAVWLGKVADKSAPDGYTMDHSSQVLLFGRDGKFVSTIALEEGDNVALDKLRRIVG